MDPISELDIEAAWVCTARLPLVGFSRLLALTNYDAPHTQQTVVAGFQVIDSS